MITTLYKTNESLLDICKIIPFSVYGIQHFLLVLLHWNER